MSVNHDSTRLRWRAAITLDLFLYLLMLASVMLLLIDTQLSRKAYYALCLIGLLLVATRKVDCRLAGDEYWFFGAVLVFVGVALVSCLANDISTSFVINRYARLLLMLPVLYLLRYVHLSEEAIYWLFSAGAVTVAAIGLVEVIPQLKYGSTIRPSANDHAIVYGASALCMTVIVACAFLKGSLSIQHRVGYGLATVAGLCAVYLSLARGVWIALIPVICLVGVWCWNLVTPWKRYAALSFMVLSLFAVLHIPSVQQRFETAINEYETHIGNKSSERQVSSVAMRLDMWTAAWILFREKPLFGHGPHTFRDISPAVVEEANLLPLIVAERYGHVHNQYLEALYSSGVLGLIGLFVVWGVPAYLFYKRVRRRSGAVSRLALAGLLFIVCFWVYGLTYAPFERKSLVIFYAFSIGLLYGAIRQREREQDRLLIVASVAKP